MKTQNLSKLVMWACMGIAVLILLLFFFVGFDEVNEDGLNEPKFTNVLILGMYAYVVVLAGLTIWNLVMAVTKFRDGGLIRVITYCGGSMVLYFVLRMLFGGQEVPEGAEYTTTDLAVADAYIWTIYILFLGAAIVSVICASGMMTKSAVKK